MPGAAWAQAKKKAPAKPKTPAKTQAKPSVLTQQGTQQMAGDTVKLGDERTVGKQSPMNIALLRLEYRADRVVLGKEAECAGKDEKFLVVHFRLHNPQKAEAYVRFDTFRFTAVDEKGENHDYAKEIGTEASKESLGLSLKPGQKVEAYTYIRVPAKGTIQKLMVISPDDIAMRFVPGKDDIAPLTGSYRDPADPSGQSALEAIAVKLGEAFQLPMASTTAEEFFDLAVVKVETAAGPIGDTEPDEDGSLVVLTLKVKNASSKDGAFFRFDSYRAALKSSDGETFANAQTMLHATDAREVEFHLDKGGEATFRTLVKVPKSAKLKSLTLRGTEDSSRSFVVDLAGAQ